MKDAKRIANEARGSLADKLAKLGTAPSTPAAQSIALPPEPAAVATAA